MSAKKQRTGIVFLAVLATALLASTCLAAEGETVSLKGFVSVLRDVNDVITSVQLVTDQETYSVVLDAKGLELGDKMEGEEAAVDGVVSKEGDQKWLKVLTFKAVEEEQK
ncbi:MAG: hypothetical protein WAK60_05860 [Sedimentisphaerales bacterium]